jgi:hypothetical protein
VRYFARCKISTFGEVDLSIFCERALRAQQKMAKATAAKKCINAFFLLQKMIGHFCVIKQPKDS